MNGSLVRALRGWRKIRVRGRRGERLFSDVARHGYRIWRIERVNADQLTAYVTEDGFFFVKKVADERDIVVDSLEQGGMPVRWNQMKSRPFMGVGFLTSLLLIWYATSHVWAVQVGTSNLAVGSERQLIAVAERSGIRVGASRSALNIPVIRQHMLQQLPHYAWIGIHVKGMVVVIDVVRLVERPHNHLAPKLVASDSGTVTAVYVYMGEPEVAVGERVTKGQTLISGVVTGTPPRSTTAQPHESEDSVTTPAEGEVYADVTYRSRVFQPFRERVLVPSGKHYIQRFVSFDQGKQYALPTLSEMPYRYYAVSTTDTALRFSGVKLPIRIIRMVYNEEVPRTIRLQGKAALAEGMRSAVASMKRRVPPDAKQVRQNVVVKRGKDGLWITLTWVMNRNIALMPSTVHKSS